MGLLRAACILVLLCSCATQEHWPSGSARDTPNLPPYSQEDFSVGDRVVVHRNDGRRFELVVEAVSETGISGEAIELAFADMDLAVVVNDENKGLQIFGTAALAAFVVLLPFLISAGIAAIFAA